jgi:hypothetical protein
MVSVQVETAAQADFLIEVDVTEEATASVTFPDYSTFCL